MTDHQDVISALIAEGEEVHALVEGLTADQWGLATPAPGWSVTHQIAHLIANFQLATLAAASPDAFRGLLSRLSDDFDANVRGAMADHLSLPAPALLDRFRQDLHASADALARVPSDRTVPWLINPLPPGVLAGAGMMELFAHGQDIADALGARRERNDGIRHIVVFGIRTRDFGYLVRGQTPPPEEFRFELAGPSGQRWEFGPSQAADRITGSAEDFCLLVTRRRHHADLGLTATGPNAPHWLDIAQAYRGPAGGGRTPGQFTGV